MNHFVAALHVTETSGRITPDAAHAALASTVQAHAFRGHRCDPDGVCYLYGTTQLRLIQLCDLLVLDMWCRGVNVGYSVSISEALALQRLWRSGAANNAVTDKPAEVC